jgi:hypothetical protein
MQPLKNKIKYKENSLKQLKEQLKASFESVKEHWNSTYHSSFTDNCEMIYLLMQGEVYNPYNFGKTYQIKRAKDWKTEVCFDYCSIYLQEYGNPDGFISLESGLFDATSSKHKKMWLSAIKDKKEERGFEDFKSQLKTDLDFLLKTFENAVKEQGSGAYSTDSYLIEFEEKKLKTVKYYIYLEDTSRRS